jgi:glycosyltransferase involved in cell wall biosynthesis
MPAYNAAKFINEAIESVIRQTFNNWELIIINDGSNDETGEIVKRYHDDRIRYFEQVNRGVSVARNLGLEKMRGNYFCFLDSDDVIPMESLQSRLNVFYQHPDISFVDGRVISMNEDMTIIESVYVPKFSGYPYEELLHLSSDCYFGPSWMIKREHDIVYKFVEGMTHAEDLYFYISISNGKKYSYTSEEVLHYRVTGQSAMSNLEGLEKGYKILYNKIRDEQKPDYRILIYLRLKLKKIMFLSYLFDGKMPLKALKALFSF